MNTPTVQNFHRVSNATKFMDCPFCGMPCVPKIVFDAETQSFTAECDSCYACGPRETTKEAAEQSWFRRSHDVEWRYKMGLRIARRFCSALGQSDEAKIEALAKEIGNELAN